MVVNFEDGHGHVYWCAYECQIPFDGFRENLLFPLFKHFNCFFFFVLELVNCFSFSITVHHPCSSNSCTHICLVGKNDDRAQCSCPMNMILMEDNSTCGGVEYVLFKYEITTIARLM